VSIERTIAESADAYYQALLGSTRGRREGTADPGPWLGYFTRLIASAYAVFAERAAAARTPGTKQERIREHILRHAPRLPLRRHQNSGAGRQRPADPARPGTAKQGR
jgi:beta-lactamase class D